jgi:polyisoprenyl-phosphate glycosyltransferase
MISIIVPAFDEEGAIGATVAALKALPIPDASAVDIVVVDDGSKDGTAAAAVAAGAQVVKHPHNLGYGRALKSGIDAAQHDTIVIIDADGTYPIDMIPRLLAKFHEGYDMVVGARSGQGFRESALKTALRAVLTFLVEFTTGRNVPDVNSGLRVFSRRSVQPYFRQLSNTFSFTTSLTLAYMMTGRFVAYVEIPYQQRIGRTKVRLLRDALRTLQYIVQAIVFYNPLKIFLLLALLTLLITLVAVAIALAVDLPGAWIVGSAGVLTAILIFSLGLLGDLIRQSATR